MKAFQRLVTSFALAIVVLAFPLIACSGDKTTEVFLVRHAEKSEGRNPPLNQAGQKRAAELALMLRNAGISHILSTDYLRTRETAAPVVQQLGLELRIYNPNDLEALAENLKGAGGRHLVVGHSNTTPELVKLLGGNPGTEINEPREYDRLYIVGIAAGGEVTTVLLRYGAPYISP